MKCVHYEIRAKKDGKVVIKNFGWFNKDTDVKKYLEAQYNKRLFEVVITK